MRRFGIVCLMGGALWGQSGTLATPSAGYVFDAAAKALIRVQGIPGAAVAGPAVDFGAPISAAWVSPAQDFAIVSCGDGPLRLFRLAANGATEVPVTGLAASRRIFFSPSGKAAVIVIPGSVQVLTGLPGAPSVAATLPVVSRARVRGVATESVAVSDDGRYVLFSSGGGVELLGVAGDNRRIATAPPGSLVAFAAGGHDAVAVSADQIVLYQDIAGAATERILDGVANPSAVAFSPDGAKLAIASASGRSVTTISVSSGERTAVACDCAPVELLPMGGFLRLNEPGTGPIWLLDVLGTRGLVFIPAPAAQ